MSMCKGPLGTLRGPWGTSGQHVTLGGGGGGTSGQHVTLGGGGGGPLVNMLHWGGDLWSTCYIGGGPLVNMLHWGGGGGASACSTHFHTSVDLTHP